MFQFLLKHVIVKVIKVVVLQKKTQLTMKDMEQ